MSAFFIFIHVIICVLLGTIILMQSGRGGGLTESFAQAGEMFGAKTNEMLIKATTVISVVFFATCLILAILSAQRGKSLMATQAMQAPVAEDFEAATQEVPLDELEPAAAVGSQE